MTEKNIKKITVIGAGTMGVGIAQVFMLSRAKKVNLIDISESALQKAKKILKNYMDKLTAREFFPDREHAIRIFNKLNTSTQLDDKIKNSDLIIEVIPEDIELKRNLLSKIGDKCSDHTIIASNTSTFTITELGEASKKPENTIGMHFFLPPFTRSCIEVMKGEKTSDKVFNTVVKFSEKIPVRDGTMYIAPIKNETPGFIANSLLLPATLYINLLADIAIEKGLPFEQLDADAQEFMKRGPFELTDYLGLDTAYKSLKSFEKRVSSDFTPGKVLTDLVSKGYYGKKTGRGFYQYNENGKPIIDKSQKSGLLNPEMLLAIHLNEGCRLLENKIVPNYTIIEKVMKIGVGIAGPFTPGKFNFKKWSELLTGFANENNIDYFKPCELMKSGKFREMRK